MLEQWIMTFGYAVIFAGTFLEGETVLIIGGYLAHAGYLELPWVIAVAFAGAFSGDQLFFFLGRKKGMAFLEKRPQWQLKSAKALTLMHRHEYGVIVGFRFLYGMRTVIPFLIGAGGVSPAKFQLLNAVGAALWSVVIAGLGYLLGQAVSPLLAEAHRIELYGAAAIALAAVAVWGVKRCRSTAHCGKKKG